MNHPDGAADHWWIEQELARLDPMDLPANAETHLARFRAARESIGSIRCRRRWAVAVVAAIGLSLLSTPDTRRFAARCIDACVVVTNRLSSMMRPSAPEAARPDVSEPGLPPVRRKSGVAE